jgi:hypothetical protein
MSGKQWSGLLNYSGTFDFGGCRIKNASDSFFQSVTGGTVKNLVLSDSSFVYTNEQASEDVNAKNGEIGNIYYSPIVRYATNVNISNVTVESSVTVFAQIFAEKAFVGAVLGLAEGERIRVENCSFHGTIENDSGNVVMSGFGAIAGGVMAPDQTSLSVNNNASSKALVIGCQNTGSITNVGGPRDVKMGGVVGKICNGAIVACSNTGTISAQRGTLAGGIVGYLEKAAAVSKCINSGKITGEGSCVGGIVAYSNGFERWITSCVNLGELTSSSDGFNTCVGGIIGRAKGNEVITNCYNLASATPAFAYSYAEKHTLVDLTDPNTFINQNDRKLTVTNCGNLATVDEVFDKINSAEPNLFIKVNGSIELNVN